MSNLLSQSSLVMIPSGYKEDVVYSQIPTDGSGDLTFTRASNGTRINSAGLVEVCPWNLLQQSEAFSNTAVWNVLNGASVTANTTTAPNGTTTADTLTFSTNVSSNVYAFCSAPVGANVVSVYAKVASGTKQFRLRVDLPGGTTSSNFTATTEWQRFEFAVTTTTANLVFYIINDSAGTAGDLYIWGAQLNIGSTAKPYFPTTDRLNVPRLTYQNGGGGCPSLLLEKQSTNIATYSEDATQWNAGSNVGSITVTANNTISPDGTQNADKIEFPAVGSGSQYAVLFFPFTASATTYSGTFYLKGNSGGEVVWISFTKDGVNYTQQLCTLTTSWQRFNLSSTLTSGADNFQIGVDTRDSAQSAKPAQTIYVWGRQLEASSYATSYITTTSSSATRVADACYKTGISSLIGQTEGVLFVETIYNGSANTAEFNRIINITDGTSANFISLSKNQTTDELYVYCQTSAGVQVNSGAISGTSLIGRHKIALAYKSNDFVLYVDGVQKFVDTSASVPTCSRLNIGDLQNFFSSTDQFGGSVSEAILFPTRLTNAELASITSL